MIVLKMAVGENTLDPTKECSGDHGIGVKNVWLTDQKLFTGVYYPISKQSYTDAMKDESNKILQNTWDEELSAQTRRLF